MNRRNITNVYEIVRFVLALLMVSALLYKEPQFHRASVTLTATIVALLAMSLGKKYAYAIYGSLAIFYAFLTIATP